jgi:hypothetical protein
MWQLSGMISASWPQGPPLPPFGTMRVCVCLSLLTFYAVFIKGTLFICQILLQSWKQKLYYFGYQEHPQPWSLPTPEFTFNRIFSLLEIFLPMGLTNAGKLNGTLRLNWPSWYSNFWEQVTLTLLQPKLNNSSLVWMLIHTRQKFFNLGWRRVNFLNRRDLVSKVTLSWGSIQSQCTI